MKTLRIWTMGYFPFTMGGQVYRPIGANVLVNEESLFDVGRGIQAYLIVSPSGKTVVAEKRSGAIIGNSIEEVRADVQTGTDESCEQQIVEGLENAARAELIDKLEFWRRMKML